MKRLLSGSAAFAVLLAGSSVWAADIAVAPINKALPQAVSDWTGPYVGIALGAKAAATTWTTTSTSDLPGTIIDASSPSKFDPAGVRAGGYAGYNWQNQAWVYGVEFDVAYANSAATHAGIPGCTISCAPGAFGPGVDLSSVRMGWDASARARLGYLVTTDLLLYGTGGIAWQAVRTSGFCQHSFTDPQCFVADGDPFDFRTNSKTLTGWTIGGGFESKVYGNWLLRGEYRYAQFGSFNGLLDFGSTGAPPGIDFSRYNLSLNTHIATFGIAYRFGGPVIARY
jgi:outer membrane immunogenic protein